MAGQQRDGTRLQNGYRVESGAIPKLGLSTLGKESSFDRGSCSRVKADSRTRGWSICRPYVEETRPSQFNFGAAIPQTANLASRAQVTCTGLSRQSGHCSKSRGMTSERSSIPASHTRGCYAPLMLTNHGMNHPFAGIGPMAGESNQDFIDHHLCNPGQGIPVFLAYRYSVFAARE